MRESVLEYLRSINTGGFFLSEDIPWSESGTSLYLKNLKRIYVDVEQTETEDFLLALNGFILQNEIKIIRVFFATDAKTLPPTYNELVTDLRRVNSITATGIGRRQVNINTSIEADILITELEYRFTKLLT